MKLSTRISIATSLITITVASSIGGFALYQSQKSELETIKTQVETAANSLRSQIDDPVSLALVAAENSSIPLTVGYSTSDSSLSYLSEAAGTFTSNNDLKSRFVSKKFSFNSDETLIIAASREAVDAHTKALLIRLILFIFFLLGAASIFAFQYFKRDSQINESARVLEETNRKMKEFLGDASHELRTPLTVIKGYTELLGKNPGHPDTGRYLEQMSVESSRMAQLISDLLLLAEVGEAQIEKSEVLSLTSILQAEANSLRDLQPERTIDFDCEYIELAINERHFKSLVSNAFANIRQHTAVTAPVRISLKDLGKNLQLVIEDGGPGIENLDVQTFSRFDKSRSRETGGSGLGLSIIKKIGESLGAIKLSKSSLGGLKIAVEIKKPPTN
ncbi:MAG: hypothetical protein RL414_1101 [Actinomycetota bacterium]